MSLFYLTNLLHLNCKSVAIKKPTGWQANNTFNSLSSSELTGISNDSYRFFRSQSLSYYEEHISVQI